MDLKFVFTKIFFDQMSLVIKSNLSNVDINYAISNLIF